MKTPKFKPTKWKIKYCTKHKQPVIRNISWTVSYKGRFCGRYKSDCEIVEIPNVPMKINRLWLKNSSSKGWIIAEDIDTCVEYPVSHSELLNIIHDVGIPKGGIIEGQWWMWRGD